MRSINGCFEEYSVDNVNDVFIGQSYELGSNSMFEGYLDNEGMVYRKGENIPILKDVVYINDNHAVTKDGSLYYGIGNFFENESEVSFNGVKTKVYDEWMERINCNEM